MDSYDEIPYESTPITETDPDRLAVIGRLFGLEAVDPARCRVLELGCAAGGNLIPLAWRNPHSAYLGIELSARQVADGNRLIAKLGVSNIKLIEGDLLELRDRQDSEAFDYILCHGVWSWVPEKVREGILDICKGLLSPTGIAYISYNTLPGWRTKGALRDMLLYHTRKTSSPAARLAEAHRFLDFVLDGTKDQTP
jgi:SAM-dependent methyltransferase